MSLNLVRTERRYAGKVSFPERIRNLGDTINFLRDEQSRIEDLLTEISDRRSVSYELRSAISTLEGAAEEVATYNPPRLDRLAVFMPSNVLLYSYVLYLLVPSLFVHRTDFRPSSSVKSQAVRLHRMLHEVHGLPVMLQGVSQTRFVQDIVPSAEVVVFTGAYQNAEEIKGNLRGDQLFLFLGQGLNPFIVTAEANLDLAVRDAIAIRLLNSGQDCLGPDVFFVERCVLSDFVTKLKKELERLRFGDYRDPEADYGPIYYDQALDLVSLYLRRNHASIIHGGSIDFRLKKIEPTVLLGDLRDGIKPVEFFSPVFNVVAYPDEGTLGRVLQRSPFSERAMGASVYGNEGELTKLLQRKHVVTVNTTLLSVDDGNKPFGGYGRMASYVSLGGRTNAQPILLSQAVSDFLRTAG